MNGSELNQSSQHARQDSCTNSKELVVKTSVGYGIFMAWEGPRFQASLFKKTAFGCP